MVHLSGLNASTRRGFKTRGRKRRPNQSRKKGGGFLDTFRGMFDKNYSTRTKEFKIFRDKLTKCEQDGDKRKRCLETNSFSCEPVICKIEWEDDKVKKEETIKQAKEKMADIKKQLSVFNEQRRQNKVLDESERDKEERLIKELKAQEEFLSKINPVRRNDEQRTDPHDRRYADPRYADPRYADPRYADQRDSRYGYNRRYDDRDPRYDPRYRHDQRGYNY